MAHKPYGRSSDIYALGCTLYEMLTLRSAYADQTNGIFPAPVPTIYSRELERLMISMIAHDPGSRPSSSEILAHPIFASALAKISIESEMYGELMQREDENQQLQLKLRVLEHQLQHHAVSSPPYDPLIPIELSPAAHIVSAASSLRSSTTSDDLQSPSLNPQSDALGVKNEIKREENQQNITKDWQMLAENLTIWLAVTMICNSPSVSLQAIMLFTSYLSGQKVLD